MKLNRRQLRRLLLREMKILTEKKGATAEAQKIAEEKYGADDKCVGVAQFQSDINMAKRLAEQKCKMKGGKSGKKFEQLKHDGKTYIVCIMKK